MTSENYLELFLFYLICEKKKKKYVGLKNMISFVWLRKMKEAQQEMLIEKKLLLVKWKLLSTFSIFDESVKGAITLLIRLFMEIYLLIMLPNNKKQGVNFSHRLNKHLRNWQIISARVWFNERATQGIVCFPSIVTDIEFCRK